MYKQLNVIVEFLGVQIIVGITFALAILIVFLIFSLKIKHQQIFSNIKRRLLTGFFSITTLLFLFIGINSENNFMKVAQFFGYTAEFWNMEYHYGKNGPLVGFLSIADVVVMDDINYNEQIIQTITTKIEGSQTESFSEKPIVIYILSESFFDPLRLNNLEIDKDPIPFTRKMLKENTSGLLQQATIGGGTSIAEYEALTSFSKSLYHNSISTPYQFPIPELPSHPMIGDLFQKSIAIHSHDASLYRRTEVFEKFGFDKFIFAGNENSDLTFKEKEQSMPYISDDSAFKEVLKEIKQLDDESAFIYLATMQNHSPYSTDSFKNLNFHAKTDATDVNEKEIEAYLEGLSLTDKALESFIKEINNINREITIVFFGDHAPPFAQQLDDSEELYMTDYFIYQNYQNLKIQTQLSSTNYLSTLMLKHLKIAKSPFYNFMESMYDDYKILRKDSIIVDDEIINITEESKLPQSFKEYKLIQYDIVKGEQFTLDKGFY